MESDIRSPFLVPPVLVCRLVESDDVPGRREILDVVSGRDHVTAPGCQVPDHPLCLFVDFFGGGVDEGFLAIDSAPENEIAAGTRSSKAWCPSPGRKPEWG